MTRGLDDQTLTLKQNYVTLTKAIGDTKVKHISLLILKISFSTLFGRGVKVHKINPIYGSMHRPVTTLTSAINFMT